MVETDSHVPMLLTEETSSLILTKVLVCGGKLCLKVANNGFSQSEFRTERTAVEEDWEEPKFSLAILSVVKFNLEPRTENGTL
jgi:hypothetical protein